MGSRERKVGNKRRMCLVRGVSHTFERVVLTPRMCSGVVFTPRMCSGVVFTPRMCSGVVFTPRMCSGVVFTPRMCSGELSSRCNPCSGVGSTPQPGVWRSWLYATTPVESPGSGKPKLSRTSKDEVYTMESEIT
ncbi:hypothetical protein WN51_12881 [Melipona quadrifasciata]|uniref:Uncharacterized protein n=1 Tax=Melipona quadrifasciata TaxID=166423 RepID=A0A0M9A555_9HYME|nr:hypothetical protein WN51_12881 [Melipona quadrifasciata]